MLSRKLLVLASAGLVLGVAAMVATAGQEAVQQRIKTVSGGTGNTWKAEPVLIYDVSGGTLLGMVHRHLSVYSNGRTSLAEFGPGMTSRNASKMINPEVVDRLRSQLAANNGLTLSDQETQAQDLPMTTVTTFKGATNAASHTFSYWHPETDYEALKQVIEGFIVTYFSDEE